MQKVTYNAIKNYYQRKSFVLMKKLNIYLNYALIINNGLSEKLDQKLLFYIFKKIIKIYFQKDFHFLLTSVKKD